MALIVPLLFTSALAAFGRVSIRPAESCRMSSASTASTLPLSFTSPQGFVAGVLVAVGGTGVLVAVGGSGVNVLVGVNVFVGVGVHTVSRIGALAENSDVFFSLSVAVAVISPAAMPQGRTMEKLPSASAVPVA